MWLPLLSQTRLSTPSHTEKGLQRAKTAKARTQHPFGHFVFGECRGCINDDLPDEQRHTCSFSPLIEHWPANSFFPSPAETNESSRFGIFWQRTLGRSRDWAVSCLPYWLWASVKIAIETKECEPCQIIPPLRIFPSPHLGLSSPSQRGVTIPRCGQAGCWGSHSHYCGIMDYGSPLL